MAHKTNSCNNNIFRHRGGKSAKTALIESIAASNLNHQSEGATVSVRRAGDQWVVEVREAEVKSPAPPR